MNSNLNRARFLPALLASTLTLALVACGGEGPLDARAAEPTNASGQPQALDPALDSLEGVTHHG